MSAGTTDPNETVTRVEYIYDGYLVDVVDRIDLSDLQLDDNDDWLYMPTQCPTESTIQDLYAWLKTEPELDVRNNKRRIDTRTFTRPKKRSTRMSFESIFEGLPPSPTNIQKLKDMDIENVKKYLSIIGDKESVPPILKPSTRTAMNVSPDENAAMSGQESMEAFINMSQCKGIDSFINLGEPEFNDLLMNVSQPSVLNTSVISSLNESIFKKNNMIPVINKNVTQSNNDMEESSSSDNINETFVMQNADNTITPDEMYRTSILSNTKEFLQLDKGLNETYSAGVSGEISASTSSLDKGEIGTLSSTFVTEPKANATFVQSQDKPNSDVKSLDTTYLALMKGAERPNSPELIVNDSYVPTMRVSKADLNVTCNILPDEIESVVHLTRETSAKQNALDMSFKVPMYNQSTPINPNVLSAASKFTTKHLDQPQSTVYPTLKAPMSLRRELLAEIHRSGEGKLDSTYNHIPNDHPDSRNTKENIHVVCNETETDVSSANRYHTYRKTAFTTATTNRYAGQNETAVIAQKELPMDQRKFYTFTKKSNSIERTDNTVTKNVEKHPNMDGTFCKPILSKAQQKRNVPSTLSKLPQFLQKSNPNLVSSSLKGAGGVLVNRMSSIGYIKGSQPNIVQNVAEKSQMQSRLHPYGKMKSGSEQQLLETNVNTNNQFPMKGVIAGSTESIESTHSVPDLDDRLSTCSDSSSHNSCTRRTMNIEQLHELVRMQEESLKQDVPKPYRGVLENTWVEPRMDLLSPILKNGVQHSEDDRHLQNIDLSLKCSSPIVSPTGSSHALNNDGNAEGNIAKTKDEIVVDEKTEGPNQVVPKIENKTRLRQPTNWNTGSKPAAVISGIPRPASRIPALRFGRPTAKITQADLRKGCT